MPDEEHRGRPRSGRPPPPAPRRSTSAAAERGYARLSAVVRWWTRGPFLDVVVVGLENVPRTGRVVVACNHPSMLNTLVPWAVMGRNPAVLVVSHALRVPLLGTVFRYLGNVAVRRDVRVGRLLDRRHALDRAAGAKAAVDVLRDDGMVQLYPEGRIPRRWLFRKDVVQTLRPGVARIAGVTGSPVVPVGIRLGWRVGPLGVQHTVRISVGRALEPGARGEAELLRAVRSELRRLSGHPFEEARAVRPATSSP